MIIVNPVDRLPLPKIERDEMRFISHDEVHHLADVIDPRYRAFLFLAGYGGLRLGELLGLRWSRVDLLRRQITVAETLVDVNNQISFDPPKTRASRRIITLPQLICDELAKVPDGTAEPGELVFRSPDGKPTRASLFRKRYWTPAVNAAGLAPLRIHDLRHCAVSLWIAAGANAKQVAARAGHTSVSVVLDRYGHVYPDHDISLIDTLEAHAQRAATR
ncbi:MAG: site-specific integrase [Acidimicrobiales bacterium]